jgi:hypothetical protein
MFLFLLNLPRQLKLNKLLNNKQNKPILKPSKRKKKLQQQLTAPKDKQKHKDYNVKP